MDLWQALCFLAVCFGIPIAFVVNKLLTRKQQMKRNLIENNDQRRETLLNPCFLDVEKILKCPFPPALKSLYQRPDLVCSTDFYFLDPIEDGAVWSIRSFLPVNSDTVRNQWPPTIGACFFAETAPCYYYVLLDSDPHTPTPVFVVNRSTGETTKVTESLTDFLNWPRISAELYHKHHG